MFQTKAGLSAALWRRTTMRIARIEALGSGMKAHGERCADSSATLPAQSKVACSITEWPIKPARLLRPFMKRRARPDK